MTYHNPDKPDCGDCCCCGWWNENGDDLCRNPDACYMEKMDAFDGCPLCDFSVESELEIDLMIASM